MLVGAARGLHTVPRGVLVASVFTSYAVALFTTLLGWPLWAIALTTLAPWLPPFVLQVASTYRRYHVLAVFYVLTVTQCGHFAEHFVQMLQVRALGLPADQAHGVVGIFDNEWVHFGWNGAVSLVVLALLAHYSNNLILWITAVISTWHGVEHVVIMWTYLYYGIRGAPGLLAAGGVLAGGLPISTTELHFYYNLLETVPLVAAFLLECARAYEQRARDEARAAANDARRQARLAHLKQLRW